MTKDILKSLDEAHNEAKVSDYVDKILATAKKLKKKLSSENKE